MNSIVEFEEIVDQMYGDGYLGKVKLRTYKPIDLIETENIINA